MTTTLVTVYRRVGDVLTDADSVTLSDDAGAAVRRVRDNAIILADAPTITISSAPEGVYSYDYGALALDSSESYRIFFRFVVSGVPFTVSEVIQAADQSTTLRGYRRDLASRLGRWGLHTTTDVADANDPSATRTLVSSELVNDDAGADKAYVGSYVLICSGALAGQQRRLRATGGYTPSTGQLIVRRPFASLPASGVVFEIHRRLPAIREDGVDGLRECINNALRVLYTPQRLAFDATSGGEQASITAYPWLRHEQQVGILLDPTTDSSRNPTVTPQGTRLRQDADTPLLEIAGRYGTGETFQVEVARPTSTYIKSGGVWGTSTVGLVDDDDEALADPILVRETALAYCYRELAKISDGSERGQWMAEFADQEKRALTLREGRMPKLAADGPGATANPPGWGVPVLRRRSSSGSRWRW